MLLFVCSLNPYLLPFARRMIRRPIGVSRFRLPDSTMLTSAGLHPHRFASDLTPVVIVRVSLFIIFLLSFSLNRRIVICELFTGWLELYTELGICVNTENSIFMKNFSDRLESLRGHLTQKQMASKIGVPLNTYTNWIREVNVPKSDQLEKICTVFGVSADWLIGLKASTNSTSQAYSVSDATVLYSTPCEECAKKQARIERMERIIDKLTK
jgi:transcriptional regulator with XRE-family HTH domain